MDAYFNDIEIHVNRTISLAQERLLIAVAWFTNDNIARNLIKLSDRKISIEIVVDDNEINRNASCLKSIIANQISVKFVKDLSKKSNIMHDKFCVIDNKKVLTGSYNWTKNAVNNDENIIVISNLEVANLYSVEFRRLKNIDASTKPIDFSEQERQIINSLLVTDFKTILAEAVKTKLFNKSALINKNNPKVNSLVRSTIELTSTNFNNKISSYWKNENLVKKYGLDYKQLATKEELAIEKDRYIKNDIREFNSLVDSAIYKFKIDAIESLISSYIKLIDKQKSEFENVIRIQEVITYLIKEKVELIEKINNRA